MRKFAAATQFRLMLLSEQISSASSGEQPFWTRRATSCQSTKLATACASLVESRSFASCSTRARSNFAGVHRDNSLGSCRRCSREEDPNPMAEPHRGHQVTRLAVVPYLETRLT